MSSDELLRMLNSLRAVSHSSQQRHELGRRCRELVERIGQRPNRVRQDVGLFDISPDRLGRLKDGIDGIKRVGIGVLE
ncbi:MAG: hypothetical protein WBP81_35260 [Solirubrobacteraceae bacterium]